MGSFVCVRSGTADPLGEGDYDGGPGAETCAEESSPGETDAERRSARGFRVAYASTQPTGQP